MQPVNFDLGSSLLQNPPGTPSLAATVPGTYVSNDQYNTVRRGIKLAINVTAAAGGGTITVTIQGKDPISGQYYTLLASTALGLGTNTLTVYPEVQTVANQSIADILPFTWRVSSVVGGTSVTATIGGSLIV